MHRTQDSRVRPALADRGTFHTLLSRQGRKRKNNAARTGAVFLDHGVCDGTSEARDPLSLHALLGVVQNEGTPVGEQLPRLAIYTRKHLKN